MEVAEIAFGQSFYHRNRNEKITFGTIAELILPMCVVKGRLELSAEALYFYGEGFGGAGQDTSSKQIDAKALLRERWIDDNSTNKCYGCNIEIKSGIIFQESIIAAVVAVFFALIVQNVNASFHPSDFMSLFVFVRNALKLSKISAAKKAFCRSLHNNIVVY